MKKIILALMLGATLFTSNSFAEISNKAMAEKIKKEHPNLQIEEVLYLPEVKLYEIRLTNTPVLSYTNEGIDFLLTAGEIIDIKNKTSITGQREALNVKRFYQHLPFDTAIKVKYGKGTRAMAMFTDPDCPFCKQTDLVIHNQLNKTDLTIYYFMNPLNIPGHEMAALKAKKIYCSPDKSKAWVNWMLNGQLPSNDGSCSTPLEQHKKIANSVNFNSTPITIFDNGVVRRGQLTAEIITQALAQSAP